MKRRKRDILIIILMILLAVALIAFPHGSRLIRIVMAAIFLWAAGRSIINLWKQR